MAKRKVVYMSTVPFASRDSLIQYILKRFEERRKEDTAHFKGDNPVITAEFKLHIAEMGNQEPV